MSCLFSCLTTVNFSSKSGYHLHACAFCQPDLKKKQLFSINTLFAIGCTLQPLCFYSLKNIANTSSPSKNHYER